MRLQLEEILAPINQINAIHQKVNASVLCRLSLNESYEILDVILDSAQTIQNIAVEIYGDNQSALIVLSEYCDILKSLRIELRNAIENNTGFEKAKQLYDIMVQKYEKFIVLAKRMMDIDISGQLVTSWYRPTYSDEVAVFSKKKLIYKTAIVMQGPIRSDCDFTLETVKLYRKLYPDCILIVSTWADETYDLELIRQAGAKVCTSKKPEHNGYGNNSFQTVSSKKGIEVACEMGCEYICKSRTDQRFYLPDLFTYLNKLLDVFPLRIDTVQNRRLVTISTVTYSNRPYNISDMFMYGTAEDVKRYFSPPLDIRDYSNEIFGNGFGFSKARVGEAWFTTHYIENLGYELKWTLEDSDYYRNELFIIVDASSIDLYWPKYNTLEYRGRVYNGVDREVTFFKWLNEQ